MTIANTKIKYLFFDGFLFVFAEEDLVLGMLFEGFLLN